MSRWEAGPSPGGATPSVTLCIPSRCQPWAWQRWPPVKFSFQAAHCSSPFPIVTHQGLPWFYLPQEECSCPSFLHIVHIVQKLQIAVGYLKHHVCILAEQGQGTGTGTFQMPPNEHGAAEDHGRCSAADTTRFKKPPFFIQWLAWYFQKCLVLCLILLIATWMTSLGAGFKIPKDPSLVQSYTSM